MPPKYVFNHVALYDECSCVWRIYPKHDKRIPKNVDCYGTSCCIASAALIEDAKRLAVAKGVKPWDIQVIL